ncbi:Aste57867_24009 [Aphanomyces stellatus]|uniref:Aste57867_24009 protein n=1 Tax=Aphanomyces stellatus TaxID=120398 RepID=A0A485LPC0_9STRA|nr:hypothetical protein As57867_023936 [Aphanomyces stellatus]VFU00652.1 Aste57867_24009 [Aphanomyces stellatus]
MPPMTACLQVLATADLLVSIAQFQPGHLHEDFMPLHKIRAPTLSSSIRFPAAEMATIGSLLSRWYEQCGSPSRVRRLCAALPHMPSILVLDAVYHGRLDVCQFLHATFDWNEFQALPLLDVAASGNQLAVLGWLESIAFPARGWRHAVVWCAQLNHAAMLEHLIDHRGLLCPSDAADAAAASGHLALLQWLLTRTTCSSVAMDDAAAHGHLDIVVFLHDRGARCSRHALSDALKGHHWDVARFLVAHRTEGVFPQFPTWVARSGDVDVARFLHELSSIRWTTQIMDEAASLGHLALVQWLHSHSPVGCTTVAMDYAAAKGHLEVVQFLVETRRMVHCVETGLVQAATNGHIDVVHYLLHKLPRGACTQEALNKAASNGQTKVVQYFLARLHRDIDPSEALVAAACKHNASMVQLLFDECGPQVLEDVLEKKGIWMRGFASDAVAFLKTSCPHVWAAPSVA